MKIPWFNLAHVETFLEIKHIEISVVKPKKLRLTPSL